MLSTRLRGGGLDPAAVHASARAFQAFACAFCPRQNKVPNSKRLVPQGAQLGPCCCSNYKGQQRPSENSRTGRTCNCRPRACRSPGLAPYQVTTFSLEIHHRNFVSGETQRKHRPPPFPQLLQSSCMGEHTQPRNSGVNIFLGGTDKNYHCLSPPKSLQWAVSTHHDREVMFSKQLGTQHKYLCSMPQVLTRSYLTGLISPWLWATRNLAIHAARLPGVRVSAAPYRLPLTADHALRAGTPQHRPMSKMLCPSLRSSDDFLQMEVAVVRKLPTLTVAAEKNRQSQKLLPQQQAAVLPGLVWLVNTKQCPHVLGRMRKSPYNGTWPLRSQGDFAGRS